MLSGRPKLLLADDSPTIRKVVSLTFGDEGMEVVAVGDGAGALRALEEDPPPDLLLADVVMPGPDGYELCERVKRDGRLRHVPVVLLVGTFEPFNEAEARRVGADTVLTKPFQSIRDLVSKVGSLLGGEAKPDEPARGVEERAPLDEPPAEARRAARADVPHGEERGAEAAPSFADLGADDELIEARPADAFGAAARRPESAPSAFAPAFAEAEEPGFHVETHSEARGASAFAPSDATGGDSDVLTSPEEEFEAARSGADFTSEADEILMDEETFPQTSFDTRAAGAAAADDALLDLGQLDAPAPGRAAEADDFVLDLGLEDDAPAPPPFAGRAGADIWDEPAREAQSHAPAWADAPSAFAEAAHGEPQTHFADAAAVVEPQASSGGAPFGEMSFGEASFDEPSPSSRAAAQAGAPDERWRDVVVQDGPQGFAFGGEQPAAAPAAPRGFVEPEVVPADEPVPASVSAEFTDGRVEGDVPRPPATDAHPAAPQQPSAAGYAVVEARAGLEETPRADQLSREAIETIARRVVELMSDKVVREIAWEVVPELAELLVKRKLEEEGRR
ncbi:MAG TPA: response regulator [Pyrinomonadaceae bacterium]